MCYFIIGTAPRQQNRILVKISDRNPRPFKLGFSPGGGKSLGH